MKKISILLLTLLVAMSACKKTPEVNLKYVDVERDLITVGTTTATVQCDYKYIATLKKAYLYYGEGENDTDMNAAAMRVVQNILYVDLAGLKSNTTYSYYYEFHNGFNSMRTALKTFKTEAGNGGGDEPPTPPEIMLPTVITALVTEITSTSANGGGEVTNDGGAEVTERGICWSTNENPTLNDGHIAAGMGLGAFTAMMNGLEANTTYHVRAYATNEVGTVYGLDKEFTTLAGGGTIELPTVITKEVSMVTSHSAQCSGEVTNDGGAEVIERGICWSISANPTISDNHVSAGSGMGTFSATMSGLQIATTYHVRAYATNEAGTAYGLDRELTTLSGGGGNGNAPIGAIDGLFSVSSTQKVYFSKGNLQYQASTGTWRFAEHQWDYVGGTDYYYGTEWGTVYENGVKCSNNEISQTYNGWIDLFGWATSGWNNNNHYYQPWDTESTGWDIDGQGYGYWDGQYADYSMYGDYVNMDWGTYNAISNGGNEVGLWRTDEYAICYIIGSRQNAAYLQSDGIVNGVWGKIILPDAWILPEGVTFLGSAGFAELNTYSIEEWEIMENAGAVFLPAAGYRESMSYFSQSYDYWGSRCGNFKGEANYWRGDDVFGSHKPRPWGLSVRLIQDAR